MHTDDESPSSVDDTEAVGWISPDEAHTALDAGHEVVAMEEEEVPCYFVDPFDDDFYMFA